jgi:hypothetical protein
MNDLTWTAEPSNNPDTWFLMSPSGEKYPDVIGTFETGTDRSLDAEGNAKFAACAPNLLTALRACELQLREYVQWHHQHAGGCSVEIESAWEQAKEAIAQAEQAKQGGN